MVDWSRPKDPVRTAVRFPLHLAVLLKTEDGIVEAMTKDISANGLLFVTANLPRIGGIIEFTMNMPAQVMGCSTDVLIHCMGRVVRHERAGEQWMAAAVIDEYFLKAS